MLARLATVSLALVAAVAECAPLTLKSRSASGKRGLAYNDPSLCPNFKSSQITWAYNWGSTGFDQLDHDFEFVAMLWGSIGFDSWNANAQLAIDAGCKHLVAFNEPDIEGQATMDAGTAAEAYKKYMNPFAGKALLGGPAVTNSMQPGQGLAWLQAFVDACNGECHIDFFPVHWYDPTGNMDSLKQHLDKTHDIADGKPVWLSEFGLGGAGSQDQQVSFLNQVLPYLDQTSYVERYAYFGVLPGTLVDGDTVSEAGKVYLS